jgi:hypothetical protein
MATVIRTNCHSSMASACRVRGRIVAMRELVDIFIYLFIRPLEALRAESLTRLIASRIFTQNPDLFVIEATEDHHGFFSYVLACLPTSWIAEAVETFFSIELSFFPPLIP